MNCDNSKYSVGDMPTLGVCPGGPATTKYTLQTKSGRREVHHLCRSCGFQFWKRYAWERKHTVHQEPLAASKEGKKIGFFEFVFGRASNRIFPY